MREERESTKNKKLYFYLFIISILSVSVIVLFTLLLNMANTAESLAVSLIDKTTGEATDQLDNYFGKVKGNLIATKQLCDQGIIDAVETENINAYLLPVFNTYEEVNTIAVANPEGDEYSIIREDSTWLSNVVYESVDSGMVIDRERWKGNLFEKEIVREWTDYKASYDPRTRPWFIGASESEFPDEPFWTEPYVFFTHQVPGITASLKSYCPYTKRTNIIQYDILLSEISEFTTTEHISENSKTFVMTTDLKIIGLPNEPNFSNQDSISKYVLRDYDKIGSEVLNSSVTEWKQMGNDYSGAFSLEINDEKWWVKITRFEVGNSRFFLIGVAVPENDFLSEVKSSRNVTVGGFLIVMIVIVLVIRQYTLKRRMNILLAQQKEQIEQQRDEIQKQHEIVVEQKHEITDSINYAKKIQEAMLPSVEVLDSILKEYFVLFRPKDIVSGDFFWATATGDWVIVTAADCTGHGVPGAFMSMLGVSFLNEIVGKKDVTNAAQVLNHLRSSIVDALKQTGAAGTQKDGMDMSLIAISKRQKKALWAGANNSLYLIRRVSEKDVNGEQSLEEEETQSNFELIEFKPDKMPVAIHEKMDSFTNHEFEIFDDDRFYLFTDGYPDQFGGPKGKKFMYKPFKRMLIENCEKTMADQKLILENELDLWTNGHGAHYEQVDDITVLGIKI